jgi:uncharacterized protein
MLDLVRNRPPSHREEVERWRADRLARLQGPDGWLSIIGLWWLEEGANTVGADVRNRVILPAGKCPPHIGRIEVEAGRATAFLDPAAGVTCAGAPVTILELQDDAAGDPTVLRMGPLGFFVIRRDGRLAVRVRDAESSARRDFSGIEHYPVDARWRFEARFSAYVPPRSVPVPTVLGMEETYEMPGAIAFEVDGTPYRLDVFLEASDSDLFVVFGDLSNRDETFGGGRYVYAKPPGRDGIVVVDFNRAYNPPCVFTPHATCPLPLPQNRLPLRIEAGEKRYRPVTPRATGHSDRSTTWPERR